MTTNEALRRLAEVAGDFLKPKEGEPYYVTHDEHNYRVKYRRPTTDELLAEIRRRVPNFLRSVLLQAKDGTFCLEVYHVVSSNEGTNYEDQYLRVHEALALDACALALVEVIGRGKV